MEKKLKWKPNVGQSYYFITFSAEDREFQCDEEVLDVCDGDKFDMPIFQTAEECLEMCSYLNRITEDLNVL